MQSRFAGIAMVCFSAFGGILFGYDTGVISGVKEMNDWLKTFGFATSDTTNHPNGYMISSSTESLVVSILSAGTFFGALFGAPVAGELPFQPGIFCPLTEPCRLPWEKMGTYPDQVLIDFC